MGRSLPVQPALCLLNMLRNDGELTRATTSDWSAEPANEVRARSAAAAVAVELAAGDKRRPPGDDVADDGLTNDLLLALLARLLALPLPDRAPARRHPAPAPLRSFTSGSELESNLDSASVAGAGGTTINAQSPQSDAPNGRQ